MVNFECLLKNFSLIWRPDHYRWMAITFDLYSALWTKRVIYTYVTRYIRLYGHLLRPVTLTPVVRCLWNYHNLFYRLKYVAACIQIAIILYTGRLFNGLCHLRGEKGKTFYHTDIKTVQQMLEIQSVILVLLSF